MKMSTKVGYISSIARTLKKAGYDTEYLYGGDINFTKMKGYLISTGFERLRWKQDYNAEEQATSKWGVCDEITFKTLGEMVLGHTDGKPFLIGYSTLGMYLLRNTRRNSIMVSAMSTSVSAHSLIRLDTRHNGITY